MNDWLSTGYGPASLANEDDLDEHMRLLTPLMGRGRNGDVAVLRMAGEHGRPCLRLREVLLRLSPPEMATAGVTDTLPGLEAALPWLSEGARLAPPDSMYAHLPTTAEITGAGDDAEADELVHDKLGAAKLRIAQAFNGEQCVPDDAKDLADIAEASYRSRVHEPVSELTCAELSSDLEKVMAASKVGHRWARTASVFELCRGVRAGSGMLSMATQLGMTAPPGGIEEYWLLAGTFAPVAAKFGAWVQEVLHERSLGPRDLAIALNRLLDAVENHAIAG